MVTDFNEQKTGLSGNLISAAIDLMRVWKNQALFSPVDLALALDKTVFGRFLIAPAEKQVRTTKGGQRRFMRIQRFPG